MDFQRQGKRALVSGSTAGIGFAIARALAAEGASVIVTALAAQQGKSPGDVERDFFLHARPTSLLKRFETPEEIAAVTAFVASPRSSGINGAALRVDGGVVRAVG